MMDPQNPLQPLSDMSFDLVIYASSSDIAHINKSASRRFLKTLAHVKSVKALLALREVREDFLTKLAENFFHFPKKNKDALIDVFE